MKRTHDLQELTSKMTEIEMTSKGIRLRRLTREIDQSFRVLIAMGKLLTEQLRILRHPLFPMSSVNLTKTLLKEHRQLVEGLAEQVGFFETDEGDMVEKNLQRVLGSPSGEKMARRTIEIKLMLRKQFVVWQDSLATEMSDRLPASAVQQRLFCQLVKAFYFQADAVRSRIDAIRAFYYLNYWDVNGFHYAGEQEWEGENQ
jgi:hypothetical protein